MPRERKRSGWVTDAIVAEAEGLLRERLADTAATDLEELRRRAGHELVTETIAPSGRRYADEALYVNEGGVIRVFVEVFADGGGHGWSKALARGEHFPGS